MADSTWRLSDPRDQSELILSCNKRPTALALLHTQLRGNAKGTDLFIQQASIYASSTIFRIGNFQLVRVANTKTTGSQGLQLLLISRVINHRKHLLQQMF